MLQVTECDQDASHDGSLMACVDVRLAIWEKLLVLGAGIHDALQLQLTQLALIHRIVRKAVPERIAALWKGDGAANAHAA